jgi:3-hydroxyacyl-[acyl-carrier-protein] dehydratase
MPPQYIFDLTEIDLNRIVYDQEAIRAANPQRGDMEMLDAIVHARPENGEIIGYKDVRPDEFWVEGHIPGRPLFPGVLMIEAAAQLASFYTKVFLKLEGFIGFGAVDNVKFRGQVLPGNRLYVIGKKTFFRHRRVGCDMQGMVDGNLVFEAQVTGVQLG